MGIGPVEAIPKAIKMAGLTKNDINLFELNEAFASQSLAVIRETGINPELVNVNGGAIALGHPLGCTGAKLTVQIMNELKKENFIHYGSHKSSKILIRDICFIKEYGLVS
jgi:acetyl-CoA acyltransferase